MPLSERLWLLAIHIDKIKLIAIKYFPCETQYSRYLSERQLWPDTCNFFTKIDIQSEPYDIQHWTWHKWMKKKIITTYINSIWVQWSYMFCMLNLMGKNQHNFSPDTYGETEAHGCDERRLEVTRTTNSFPVGKRLCWNSSHPILSCTTC